VDCNIIMEIYIFLSAHVDFRKKNNIKVEVAPEFLYWSYTYTSDKNFVQLI